MRFTDILKEAMWVIKSKDGVEKRFKNDTSPEAIAWKDTVAKKPAKAKIVKYSNEWWVEREDDVSYLPWDKITDTEPNDAIEADVGGSFVPTGYQHWSRVRSGEERIDGTFVSFTVVSLFVTYGPEDDLGVTHEVEDSVLVKISRDRTNPENVTIKSFA